MLYYLKKTKTRVVFLYPLLLKIHCTAKTNTYTMLA